MAGELPRICPQLVVGAGLEELMPTERLADMACPEACAGPFDMEAPSITENLRGRLKMRFDLECVCPEEYQDLLHGGTTQP